MLLNMARPRIKDDIGGFIVEGRLTKKEFG
jgi:hypothetical protein